MRPRSSNALLRSAPRLTLAAILCAVTLVAAVAEEPVWEDLPWDQRIGLPWFERKAESGDVEAMYRAGSGSVPLPRSAS